MPELRIVFLDAGQGDATLVVYPDNSLMLIDCGSTKSKRVVVSEIQDGIARYLPGTPGNNTIDTLVLTHPDVDHYNMLEEVSVALKLQYNKVIYGGDATDYNKPWIAALLARPDALSPANGYFSPVNQPAPDLSRQGVRGWVLAANVPYKGFTDKNANSVVLLLEYAGVKMFFMGDATRITEDYILQTYTTNLIASNAGDRVMLKVGHHGSSRTSSTDGWIQSILPQVAFISSDTRPFGSTGLPNSTTINNLRTHGDILDMGVGNHHLYVEFNDTTSDFAEVGTQEAIYTNLYQLHPHVEGGSYHYVVDVSGAVTISRT